MYKNKKSFIIVTLLISLLIAPVFVSAGTTNAGITPDSYWYFFDKAIERLDIALTFNPEKKARKVFEKAEERLAEIKEMANDELFDEMEDLLQEYEEGIKKAEERSEKLKDGEKSVVLLSSIERSTANHQEVLSEVLNLVPEEVKEAIQNIINTNMERQEKLEKRVDELQKENEELRKQIEELERKKDDEDRDDVDDEEDSENSDDLNDEKDGDSDTNHVGLKLYLDKEDNEIKLNWTATGVDTSKGFKLVEGYSENPSYSGDNATYLNGDKRNHSKVVKGGKIYHYRICLYTGDGCKNYSNNVKVWIPEVETYEKEYEKKEYEKPTATGEVKSLALYADENKVEWLTEGYSAKGFKVVWSLNENPTYPTREGDKYKYFSDPSAKTTELEAFSGSGTYYVRACEYVGGACGLYSNQVEVQLEKK